ncbi:MAG: 6-carboxytetrahydropterin synthase [Pseudomonadota bacterium]
MFEVTVTKRFRATHALGNYRGKDERPHEHEWRCDVILEAESLDASGCAADFAEVDAAIDAILAPISGNDLNRTFAGESPSAENVSKFIFRRMSAAMNGAARRVVRVTTWEDADHSASYFE